MPRPPGLPKFDTIGQRVRWWRNYRGLKVGKDFAKLVDMKPTTLSTLESGDQQSTTKLHRIASVLKLNPHYLETGNGEPEEGAPQEPPAPESPWPFPGIPRARIERLNLNRVELGYTETALLEALEIVEAERRKGKKA